MKRRIMLYVFGFGLGCIICFFLFRSRERDFSGWLPESRVLKFLHLAKSYNIDSTMQCKLNCANMPIDSIRKAFLTGSVDFGRSQTDKEPCHEYFVRLTVSGKPVDCYIAACTNDSTANLLRVDPMPDGSPCKCK
ncbi:MAG: hypothetical protein ACRCYO_06355 [Bacteroidia bacterium]